jgi:8-oxo-dGTP pyrophosphatase MutT (NUDIX family)
MSKSNEGLSKDDLYKKYNIVKMEIAITEAELKNKIEKTKISVSDYVSRLKSQGMAKKDIQALMVNDLKTGGPLFSELRSSFVSPFTSSVSRISSTVANYESAGGDPVQQMTWIASFKNTCSSCVPRHGVTKKYADWVKVGLPGNFGSYCNGYCQCRLFPIEYPGVVDMKEPNNRKQWKELMAGDKVADPAQMPGALVQSERLLAKQQKMIAERIAAAKKEAVELEERAKKIKADIAESQAALKEQKYLQDLANDPGEMLTFWADEATVSPSVLIPGNSNILGGGPAKVQSWKKFKKSVKDEPDFVLPAHLHGKKDLASGVIIKEADGRIWLVEPKGGFGGYKATFPKGRLEDGLTPAQNAAKEAFEETGMKVEITGLVGDYEKTETFTRYYIGKRVGGDPAFAHWETSRVTLCTPEQARKLLNVQVDHDILDDFLSGGKKKELADRLTAIPGTQKGSNPGGMYVDGDSGQKYYAKFYRDADQARSEYVANEIGRKLGIGAPESQLLEMVGPGGTKQIAIVAKWEEGLERLNLRNHALLMENAEEIAKQHINASLVANWDVVGLEYDNLLRMPDGKIIVIDSGGSFKFRAQGGVKAFDRAPVEFDSLLNPFVNRESSAVFSPVVEGYTAKNPKQLIAWLKGLDDAAIEDIFNKSGMSAWRSMSEITAARRDALIEQLEKYIELPKAETRAVISIKEAAAKVKASRLNGYAIPLDEDDIEDVYVLFWEEIGKGGKPVLRARAKLTPRGGEKVDDVLRQELGAPAAAMRAHKTGPQPLPEDVFYGNVLQGVKTVAYHAKDGVYNQEKVALMKAQVEPLKKLVASGTIQQKQMAMKYLLAIEDVEKAIASKILPGKIEQFLYEPHKAVEKAVEERMRGAVKPKKEIFKVEGKKVENGVAKIEGDNTPYYLSDEQIYSFDLSGDVAARYVPWTYGDNKYALRGQMDLFMDGGATEKNIQAMVDAIADIGIKNKLADPDYIELVYLHKHAYLRGDDLKSEYKVIWNSDLPAKEKVEKIKDFFEREGVKVRGNAAYKPMGEYNHFGHGRVVWRRFDLPAEQIAEDMKGYKLLHSVQGGLSMDRLIDNVLNSGGEFSATNERLRRGINVDRTMSQSSDMTSGGANYFFTRIKSNRSVQERSIEWEISELSRVDAISYESDLYGDVTEESVIRTRKIEPSGWKINSVRNSNETIFKHGIDIWGVTAIRTSGPIEREKVLAVFKKHRVIEINGKSIEEIVK